MSAIAIVPAKSISRRIPRKNLVSLAGLPMLCHSIRVAVKTPNIDAVFVTSDSQEILDVAEKCGARPIHRPDELCGDDITNFQVLRHLLNKLRSEEIDPEIIVLLQPTTPFRTPMPLDSMLTRLLDDTSADSLVTVVLNKRIYGSVENGHWIPIYSPTGNAQRMKMDSDRYELSGHAYLLRPQRTLDRGTLLGDNILAAILPEGWLDIDIDTPNDMLLAQYVADAFFTDEAI